MKIFPLVCVVFQIQHSLEAGDLLPQLLRSDAEREVTGKYSHWSCDSTGWLAGCVQGPVHFFTFPIGLRNSDLSLDGLEVHSWGVWQLFGRRTQGPRRAHGRQWLLFGKLVMLDIRQFCWDLAGELTLVDRLVGTCCWAPLRTSVF